MSAQILDGEALAKKIQLGIKQDLDVMAGKGKKPALVAIQVGENAASRVYVGRQKKACEDIGISYTLKELPETCTQPEIIKTIEGLNHDANVSGIILQMPLPKGINPRQIQVHIDPKKDVEGMHPANMGMLVYGQNKIAPCTAMGAVELLKSSGVELKGKEVVIVGHSEIVGKPIALMMLSSLIESATPTVCHIATQDLKFHTQRADVLFVAVGKPGLIKGDMIKPGAIVIDIGINRVDVLDSSGKPVLNEQGKPKKRIVGDVEFDKAKEICSYISPVPGGVGPLTVTMLLRNIVECAKMQEQRCEG